MGADDDMLVKRAAASDMDAMATLLERYAPALRQRMHIEPRWRSVLDVDDVMQVTFLEAFLEVPRLQAIDGAGFQAWLTRIADNNLRDAIRGLRRKKNPQPERRISPADFGESCAILWETLGATTTTPSRVISRDEAQGRLQAALERLPDDYRRVVQLYDLQGSDIAEVASSMNRSPGAVHMLRARAHERLRQLLGAATAYFSNA